MESIIRFPKLTLNFLNIYLKFRLHVNRTSPNHYGVCKNVTHDRGNIHKINK